MKIRFLAPRKITFTFKLLVVRYPFIPDAIYLRQHSAGR